MISLNDSRSRLFQWDTGRQVRCNGMCEQFHFTNGLQESTLDVVATFDGECSVAAIPDELLQEAKEITVYGYVGNQQEGFTKEARVFDVVGRTKPSGYTYTPTEHADANSLAKQIGDVNELATNTKDSLVAAVNEILTRVSLLENTIK